MCEINSSVILEAHQGVAQSVWWVGSRWMTGEPWLDYRHGEFFFCSSSRPFRLSDPPGFLSNVYRVRFLGVKLSGAWSWPLTPNLNMTNAWTLTFTSPYFFHCVVLRHRVILTFVCRGGRGLSVVWRTVLRREREREREGGAVGIIHGLAVLWLSERLLRCQGMWWM